MSVLGKAPWSQTPWEMTHDEQGGELTFHYVRHQIRGRTTGFSASPLSKSGEYYAPYEVRAK